MTVARHKAHEALRRLDALARQGRKGGTFEAGLRAARAVVGAVFEVEAQDDDQEPDSEATELELLRRQVDNLQAQLSRRRLADPEPTQVVDRGRVVARVEDPRIEELRDDLFAPFSRSRAVLARSAPYTDDESSQAERTTA